MDTADAPAPRSPRRGLLVLLGLFLVVTMPAAAIGWSAVTWTDRSAALQTHADELAMTGSTVLRDEGQAGTPSPRARQLARQAVVRAAARQGLLGPGRSVTVRVTGDTTSQMSVRVEVHTSGLGSWLAGVVTRSDVTHATATARLATCTDVPHLI